MSFTNYPNGITSFGSPVMPAPQLWLPKDALVRFISDPIGSDNAKGDYDRPYATGQQAVNQVPQGGGDAITNRGAMIYYNPGEYASQTIIADRRYIRLIGAGQGLTFLSGGNSTGTTFTPSSGLTADNASLVIAARGTHVTGFTIRGVGSAYGVYVGDGGRYDSSYNYDASDCQIYGNHLRGENTFVGRWAVVLDGCGQNFKMFNNSLYEWLNGGVLISSGINQTSQGPVIAANHFLRIRGIGVQRANGALATNVCVGPFNTFADDVTTVMTRSVSFGTGDMEGVMVGNWDMTANGAIGQSTDRMGGNFEAHGMDSPVYPAES